MYHFAIQGNIFSRCIDGRRLMPPSPRRDKYYKQRIKGKQNYFIVSTIWSKVTIALRGEKSSEKTLYYCSKPISYIAGIGLFSFLTNMAKLHWVFCLRGEFHSVMKVFMFLFTVNLDHLITDTTFKTTFVSLRRQLLPRVT